MAIDNSSYDALKDTYFQIKEYLETTQLGREHSPMILKQEELEQLLEHFDVEALEEQSKEIHALHAQLDDVTEASKQIVDDLKAGHSSEVTVDKVTDGLEKIFLQIKNIAV